MPADMPASLFTSRRLPVAMKEMQITLSVAFGGWPFGVCFKGGIMKRNVVSFRSNAKLARELWGEPSRMALRGLRELTARYALSVAAGDLQLLEGRWYVTHSGLLQLASRRGCRGIRTIVQDQFSDLKVGRWVFKAIVYKSGLSRGFVGYGDADPSNTSSLVRGAEMRVAETRAVNRALRKAYGIGLCSVEELGHRCSPRKLATPEKSAAPNSNGNGSSNGQPRLRDRLCLLIREHQLDASLVKRYAADFCGTDELRSASRTLVESYIAHLSEWAIRDHTGLVAKLENYSASTQVHS